MPHGGARPGSGPKPKPDAMVARTYLLRQDQIEWLARQAAQTKGNKSGVIRALIEHARRASDRY